VSGDGAAEGGDDGLEQGALGQASDRRKGRGGAASELRESDTLAPPEALAMKGVGAALEADPLFQRTSALFDEGGAKGRW